MEADLRLKELKKHNLTIKKDVKIAKICKIYKVYNSKLKKMHMVKIVKKSLLEKNELSSEFEDEKQMYKNYKFLELNYEFENQNEIFLVFEYCSKGGKQSKFFF